MNVTVEIDKAGRIVVPKKIRDAMRLRAGEQLSVEFTGDRLLLERPRKARGLYETDGLLVYESGGPVITTEAAFRMIDEVRDDRMRHILGATSGE